VVCVVRYKRGAWLGKMTEGYKLLAVAGSHGKSTTVAMLAVALCILGEDITVILGAQVPQFPKGRNAMVGKGHLFLLEADEYDGCFLGVSPSLAVVTNVEWEHVDMFPDYEAVRDMFRKFVMRIKPGGLLLVNGDRLQFTR
jgi:UDP-N-acetylmuramate-alanine ligase